MKSFWIILNSLVLTVSYTSAAAVGKLPPSFDVCPMGKPNFDSCVERAIEKALKVLVKGYAPLGIYSIDPLHISSIDIDQGQGSSPVSINLKFRELDIKGLSNSKIQDFRTDMKTSSLSKFTGKIVIPKVTLEGQYSIDGKVLVLPIKGDGDCKLVLDGVVADLKLTGKHYNKDGVTYMQVTNFDFNFETNNLGLSFSNLFNGDKALGDNMNKFLNENWQDILNELKPSIQQTFGMAFGEISNRIFTKVPFNDIFPKV